MNYSIDKVSSDFISNICSSIQRFGTIQDAILRRLCDEDITVVQAALNLEALPEIISAPLRIDAFRNVLQRCIKLLSSGILTFAFGEFCPELDICLH